MIRYIDTHTYICIKYDSLYEHTHIYAYLFMEKMNVYPHVCILMYSTPACKKLSRQRPIGR